MVRSVNEIWLNKETKSKRQLDEIACYQMRMKRNSSNC